ncbi:MAG TPA: S41 family peptidase [Caulobacteraceae bacterium]|jgi:hypothetical protein
MIRQLASLIAAACLAATAGAAHAAPAIPDTPAGHVLGLWLAAMDSGDPARLAAYRAVDPETAAHMASFRAATGGFDLVSITTNEPLHLRFELKARTSGWVSTGNLVLADGQPSKVLAFALRPPPPPGASTTDVKLDAGLRRRVIDAASDEIGKHYVDGPLAAQMVAAIRAKAAAGAYDAITDGDVFASRLTEDLRAVSHDLHLRIDFQPFKLPSMADEPSPAQLAQMRAQMLSGNCAFDKVEILPGNIGYVKFDGFGLADVCAPTAVAAMAFVAHADALIFDLRENGGGDPQMVSFIASYLFDEPTHLNDLYNRFRDTTAQFWTLSYLPGARLPTQPVYVLTSHDTFSGAEEFSYDLQQLKRATIVGETTGGGAHPVAPHVIADYFIIAVPFAKAVNPVSKTNWEGTGVEPDVKAPAADALAVAEKLAAAAIQAKASPSPGGPPKPAS